MKKFIYYIVFAGILFSPVIASQSQNNNQDALLARIAELEAKNQMLERERHMGPEERLASMNLVGDVSADVSMSLAKLFMVSVLPEAGDYKDCKRIEAEKLFRRIIKRSRKENMPIVSLTIIKNLLDVSIKFCKTYLDSSVDKADGVKILLDIIGLDIKIGKNKNGLLGKGLSGAIVKGIEFIRVQVINQIIRIKEGKIKPSENNELIEDAINLLVEAFALSGKKISADLYLSICMKMANYRVLAYECDLTESETKRIFVKVEHELGISATDRFKGVGKPNRPSVGRKRRIPGQSKRRTKRRQPEAVVADEEVVVSRERDNRNWQQPQIRNVAHRQGRDVRRQGIGAHRRRNFSPPKGGVPVMIGVNPGVASRRPARRNMRPVRRNARGRLSPQQLNRVKYALLVYKNEIMNGGLTPFRNVWTENLGINGPAPTLDAAKKAIGGKRAYDNLSENDINYENL